MMKSNKKLLNKYMNLAIASAKIQSIKIKQPVGTYTLRPQIHLIIAGNRGTCKSTAITQVSNHFNQEPYNDITAASLVGTIDSDTKEVIEGAAWDNRNSVCCIDEFMFRDRAGRPVETINILLSLMEGNQYYKRKLALKNKMPVKKQDGDCYFLVNDGQIEVKTNFSLIIGTMSKLKFSNIKLQAFLSRCIPIEWAPNELAILDIATGNPLFDYEDLTPKNREVTINQINYMEILEFVKSKNPDIGIYLRAIGDCCRIFAILGRHDKELYEDLIFRKNEF